MFEGVGPHCREQYTAAGASQAAVANEAIDRASSNSDRGQAFCGRDTVVLQEFCRERGPVNGHRPSSVNSSSGEDVGCDQYAHGVSGLAEQDAPVRCVLLRKRLRRIPVGLGTG